MELRQIKQVLSVARHGAVRRAAETLGIDKAIVSNNVRDLELELGVKLFERHSAGVRLTASGSVFVAGAAKALEDLDDVIFKARAAGRGVTGQLNIGYVWSLAAGPGNALLVEQRRQAPEVDVVLREHGVSELSAGLMDRGLDIAFLVGDAFPRKFESQSLWKERIFFAIAASWTLPNEVGWEILAEQPLLVSAWEDWTLYQSLADKHGGPRLDPHFHDCSREGVLGLVAAGRGVAVAPQSTTLIPFPGVSFVAIADPDAECTVSAAWLKENDNSALKTFIQLLRQRYPNKRRRGG